MRASYRPISIGAFVACVLPRAAAADPPAEAPSQEPVDVVVLPPATPDPVAPSTPLPAPTLPGTPPSRDPLAAGRRPGPLSDEHGVASAPIRHGESDSWRWYGWQIIASDLFAVGTFALAGAVASGESGGDHSGSSTLLGVGLSQYVMGGFTVHAAQRRWLSAGLSIGLRVVLPLVGAAVGAALASNQGENDVNGLVAVSTGILGGAGLAHLLDVSALSLVPPRGRPEGAASATPSAPALTWFPVIRVATENRSGSATSPSATILGVGATF